MIVVDTSGLVALLDADDRHHRRVRAAYEEQSAAWVLPWAILPEVDYLVTKYLGSKVALALAQDLAAGVFRIEGVSADDLKRAARLQSTYSALSLGLVDSVVMAQTIRLKASAIVTLDSRHFRAVRLGLKPPPALIPLDLAP